jgi:hypothetical protein
MMIKVPKVAECKPAPWTVSSLMPEFGHMLHFGQLVTSRRELQNRAPEQQKKEARKREPFIP